MNKEVLSFVKLLSNAKSIEPDAVFEALEAALVTATKKIHGGEMNVRVTVDRESGNYETERYWTVVDDDEFDINEDEITIKLTDAKQQQAGIEIGGEIIEPMESVDFGRISAQAARGAMIQEVRKAERKELVRRYTEKLNELVSGVVKKVTREGAILDLGENVEAFLPREEMLPSENLRNNDRIRAFLYDVHYEPRGPQLFVSRTHKDMLVKLFEIEVPEIGEQVLLIMGAARDPGARSKIAVKTNDGRIDPIGACVGMRGSRVQAVSGELGGERVDIILWDDNPAQMVINAMAPAEVESIVLDDDTKTIDIAVSEEQLSQAIGRNGQNVRLASELMGWTLNVMSAEAAQEKSEAETEKYLKHFIEALDVEEDVAAILVEEGYTNVEEVAYVPVEEMCEIAEFDEEIVEELRNRAKEALLSQALASKAVEEGKAPAKDLLEMKGMTEELAHKLAKNEVITMEDLAELAVDDLLEIAEMTEEQAAALIMTAREPWFTDDDHS